MVPDVGDLVIGAWVTVVDGTFGGAGMYVGKMLMFPAKPL